MTYHIITYATHVQGKLNELVNNPFGVPVTVLGMGNRWNGFMDKPIAVYNHIHDMDDEEIVVVLDGFDTVIHQHPDLAIQRFIDMKLSKVLVSNENYFNGIIGYYLQSKFFGLCKQNNKRIANAGMLMGYVRDLKKLYHQMIVYHYAHPNLRGDDQRILNHICMYDLYTIDHENIFYNVTGNIFVKSSFSNDLDVIFVSYPGRSDQSMFEKLKRGYSLMNEYSKVFWKEFVCLFICCLFICIYCIKLFLK